MGQPQFFQIAQATPTRRHFHYPPWHRSVVLDGLGHKTPAPTACCDHIDHLAVDGGGLVGEIVMQGFAGRREAEHRDHHATQRSRSGRPPFSRLTVQLRRSPQIVAAHGGSTFQTNMFSTVKIAFDVAVMRLVKQFPAGVRKK